jgi:hypothetical protein
MNQSYFFHYDSGYTHTVLRPRLTATGLGLVSASLDAFAAALNISEYPCTVEEHGQLLRAPFRDKDTNCTPIPSASARTLASPKLLKVT